MSADPFPCNFPDLREIKWRSAREVEQEEKERTTRLLDKRFPRPLMAYLPIEAAKRLTQIKIVVNIIWLCAGIMAFVACNHYHPFSWNYAGNAVFEYVGSFMLMKNVFKLYADKMVRGYHWSATAFFMGWGYWNVFYYPSVGDYWSFTAGLFIVAVNTFWLAQMWYYRDN